MPMSDIPAQFEHHSSLAFTLQPIMEPKLPFQKPCSRDIVRKYPDDKLFMMERVAIDVTFLFTGNRHVLGGS
jgi:hypothetical protein